MKLDLSAALGQPLSESEKPSPPRPDCSYCKSYRGVSLPNKADYETVARADKDGYPYLCQACWDESVQRNNSFGKQPADAGWLKL